MFFVIIKKKRNEVFLTMKGNRQMFEKVEDESIFLISYEYREELKNSRVVYEKDNQRFLFSIFDGEEITINFSELELKEDPSKRVNFTIILNKLMDVIQNDPRYKLRFMLRQCQFDLFGPKYIIGDVENFDHRKKSEFILQNKEKIDEIVETCFKKSPSSKKSFYSSLVIKEDDERLLVSYLQERGILQHIVTFDDEDYVKVNPCHSIDNNTFLDLFSEEMKKLGYNLYEDFLPEN